MAVDFRPEWLTGPGDLGMYVEGQSISIGFAAEEVAILDLQATTSSVDLGIDATPVIRVLVDGVPVTYSTASTIVSFTALSRDAIVKIVRQSGATSYSIQSGDLPVGLTFANGILSGTVGAITPAGVKRHELVIRATFARNSRDITCYIWTGSISVPLTFDADLPAVTTDPDLGISYRLIGSYVRGEPVSYTLGVETDGIYPVHFSQDHNYVAPALPNSFDGPPPGLRITGDTLFGFVSGLATPGKYIFKIDIKNSIAEQASEIFCVEVRDEKPVAFDVITRLVWTTPAGSLGVIDEGENSFFSVSAESTTGKPVTYALAPGSALPFGLTLDSSSGEISGTIGYGAGIREYTFAIRASTGRVFADRAFSFGVNALYRRMAIRQLVLELDEETSKTLMATYDGIIDSTKVYRSLSAGYGLVSRPSIYMLKGLNAHINLADEISAFTFASPANETYFKPIRLLIGNHGIAYARDPSGGVIYEVLYRELLDFQEGAGGYAQTDYVTHTPIPWPHAKGDPEYVLPISLRNMRYSLIKVAGFPVPDSIAAQTAGLTGPESLPRWMRSRQIVSDASSSIGYRAAIVLAYLKPGTGTSVLRAVNLATTIPQWGGVYEFNRLYDTLSGDHIQL